MKLTKLNIATFFISGSLLLTSCEAVQNANNTQKGAAIGTAAADAEHLRVCAAAGGG